MFYWFSYREIHISLFQGFMSNVYFEFHIEMKFRLYCIFDMSLWVFKYYL